MDPKDKQRLGESDTDAPAWDDQIIYFESETGRWLSNGDYITTCHTMVFEDSEETGAQ
jgi:hypothetical protein